MPFRMKSRWTSKTWRRVSKLARIILVVTLCVLLVSPLRNLLFFPMLPGAWRAHSSFRLVRMLLDNQHFPIDDPFSHSQRGSKSVSLSVNLSDVDKFLEKEDPFKEFYSQRNKLEERAKHDSEAAAELALIDNFKPIISLKERAQLMFTMDVFVRACRKHGLTFFLFEGSLLGSYRHHGLIPWDDDIDIAINSSQWQEVRQVLGNIPGFTLYASPDSQWKFFLSDLPAFYDKPFKWPNLDLLFFTEHDSYVWSLTWGFKNHLIVDKKYLLPLSTVKWEHWQLPAPACVERIVMNNYDVDKCATPGYIHKTNEEYFIFQTQAVDCSRLHKYYPFVFRHRNVSSSRIVENKRVGGRLIHDFSLPPIPQVCLE